MSHSNQGKDFEKEVGFTFPSLCKRKGVAFLSFMPVPTAPIMVHDKWYRVLSGKAPFDVYGSMRTGQFIGAEVKHNVEAKPSLRIVPPEKDGSGLEYHQLAALCLVAESGGIARVVWLNGDRLLHLCNNSLIMAKQAFDDKVRKSIRAEEFDECEQDTADGFPFFDWIGDV